MTIMRGQIYQFNLHPETFFSVQRIYSPSKILIMDMTIRTQMYVSENKLLTTCTLMPYLPENRMHNSYNVITGISGVKLSFGLTTPFTYGSVQARGTVSYHKALAPTYLRGRLSNKTILSKTVIVKPLALGGRLAAKGTVIQAHAYP